MSPSLFHGEELVLWVGGDDDSLGSAEPGRGKAKILQFAIGGLGNFRVDYPEIESSDAINILSWS